MNAEVAIKLHNGHILGIAAFVTPTLGVFAPRGLAVLFVAAALGVIGVCLRRPAPFPAIPRRFALLFGAAVIWGLASSLWSVDSGLSLKLSLPLAGIFLGGLVLCAAARDLKVEERRFLERSLISGVCIAYAFLFVEVFFDAPLVRLIYWGRGVIAGESLPNINYFAKLKNGTSVAALTAWPAAMILWQWRRKWAALILLTVCFVLVAKSDNEASTLALVIGVLAAGAALKSPRRLGAVLSIAVVAGVLIAPIAPRVFGNPKDNVFLAENLPSSQYYRFIIWNFTADRIAERPLLGWGLNASRVIPGGNEQVLIYYEPATGGRNHPGGMHDILPLHPHNAFLQWWLELGLIGAAVYAIVVVAMILALPKAITSPAGRAAGYGAIVSALVIANLSYGVWQSWWLASLFLTAAFLLAPQGESPDMQTA